jgi:curved DNA-binding protein CbpA
MEFSVLGIPENSSLEDAKKALKQIRINNHPDKNKNATQMQLQTLQNLVNLAEEAFQRINSKYLVTSVIDNVIASNQDIMRSNYPIKNNTFTQYSSYTYQNINGNIQEFGIINEQPMSKQQLNQYKMYY